MPPRVPPNRNYLSPNVSQHILQEVQTPTGESPQVRGETDVSEVRVAL